MSMLKSLAIEFWLKKELAADKHKLPVLLDQYLRQNLADEQAQLIEAQPICPYSQYVLPSGEKDGKLKFTWQINALNTIAAENILYPLYKRAEKTLFLNEIVQPEIESRNYVHSATYNQLVAKNFTSSRRCRFIEFSFMTNTVLSSADRVSFPLAAKEVISDLLWKWNCFAEKDIIDNSAHSIADDLAEQMQDEDYNLNIRPYSREKGISSFTGSCTWRLNANIMSQKLLCILAQYAPYCGIGINNHLGMGAVQTNIYNYRKDRGQNG